jgi:hypothetical protein
MNNQPAVRKLQARRDDLRGIKRFNSQFADVVACEQREMFAVDEIAAASEGLPAVEIRRAEIVGLRRPIIKASVDRRV